MHIYACICIYMYIHVYVCIYMYMYVYICFLSCRCVIVNEKNSFFLGNNRSVVREYFACAFETPILYMYKGAQRCWLFFQIFMYKGAQEKKKRASIYIYIISPVWLAISSKEQ